MISARCGSVLAVDSGAMPTLKEPSVCQLERGLPSAETMQCKNGLGLWPYEKRTSSKMQTLQTGLLPEKRSLSLSVDLSLSLILFPCLLSFLGLKCIVAAQQGSSCMTNLSVLKRVSCLWAATMCSCERGSSTGSARDDVLAELLRIGGS